MSEKPAIPIPKPRTSRVQFMNMPVAEAEPIETNMVADPEASRAADLNFKVQEDFHRAFKQVALHMGISMKQLLDESFALYVARNGLSDVVRDARAGVMQTRQRGRLEREAQKQRDRRARKKAEQYQG